MKMSEFESIIKEYNRNACCSNRIYPREIYSYEKRVKRMTTLVDYECKFKDGKCKNLGWSRVGIGCCCKYCAKQIGYFKDDMSKRDIKIYAYLFDKVLGWWKKGEGCTLPRSLRSYVCLDQSCSDKLKKQLKVGYEREQQLKRRVEDEDE